MGNQSIVHQGSKRTMETEGQRPQRIGSRQRNRWNYPRIALAFHLALLLHSHNGRVANAQNTLVATVPAGGLFGAYSTTGSTPSSAQNARNNTTSGGHNSSSGNSTGRANTSHYTNSPTLAPASVNGTKASTPSAHDANSTSSSGTLDVIPTASPHTPKVTHSPTMAPTTLSPSIAPTLTPIKPQNVTNLVMVLEYVPSLSPSVQEVWQNITSRHLEKYWYNIDSLNGIGGVKVTTKLVSQSPDYVDTNSTQKSNSAAQPVSGSGTRVRNRRDRHLMQLLTNDGIGGRRVQTSAQSVGDSSSSLPPPLTLRYTQIVTFHYVPSSSYNGPKIKAEDICTYPFDKLKWRLQYLQDLQASNVYDFQNAHTVSQVSVQPYVPPAVAASSSAVKGPMNPLTFYLIVGAAAGGAVVLILLIACFIYKRRRRTKAEMYGGGKVDDYCDDGTATRASSPSKVMLGGEVYDKMKKRKKRKKGAKKLVDNGEGLDDDVLMPIGGKASTNNPIGFTSIMNQSNGDYRVDQTIDVSSMREDDVSTLGDPLSPYKDYGLIRCSTKESMVETIKEESGSIQYDYDYSNAYGGIQDVASNSISGATGKRTNQIGGGVINKSPQPLATPVLGIASTGESSVFSDDDSFEKQFGCPEEKIVIHAPAGKLGVVIDTFDGGLAGVNAIKDDSVLADRLKIGDVLISVDGQETAGMTALQVSRLIGQRSEYPRRELIFTRKTQE